MKNALYIAIIVILTVVSTFLFLENRRSCAFNGSPQGHGGRRGMGGGMGMGADCNFLQKRTGLFELIQQGSTDTAQLFLQLEEIVSSQRNVQKEYILRVIAIRDSLQGRERQAFLNKLNRRFCEGKGQCPMK